MWHTHALCRAVHHAWISEGCHQCSASRRPGGKVGVQQVWGTKGRSLATQEMLVPQFTLHPHVQAIGVEELADALATILFAYLGFAFAITSGAF